jgi:aspartyl/asparaginyl-tRNA synthetase
VHAPILTSEDCEGAGEQFRVSTLTHPLPLKDGQVPCNCFCE